MMNKREELSRKAYYLAIRLYYDLYNELNYHRRSRKYLTFNEYKTLETYYHRFNFASIKYLAHSEARLLRHVVEKIVNSQQTPKVLDAGCGLGSHAIFFSFLGADVVGVDLDEQRLNIARKRVKYYQEKYGRELNVKFYLKNILKFCEINGFDIIWCNQAISHIHPIEEFLAIAWRNLKEGGYLIICDSNSTNPYISFCTWLVHMKGGRYKLIEDPETHELIPYARERLFTPPCLCNLLRKIGYTIELVEYHKFFPPHLNRLRFFRITDEVLSRVPFIRTVGTTYIVIARKNS